MSNLPLLIIGDYYYYSHNKMMKGKIETGQGYGMGIGDAINYVNKYKP